MEDASTGLPRARSVPSAGGCSGSPPPSAPYTSIADSWAAFQPVLAVTRTLRWRTSRPGKVSVTVLARSGSKRWAAEADSAVNDEPSVLPSTARVWVRASQAAGSFSTTSSTRTAPPRSTRTDWGKEPKGPSQ